MQKLTIITTMSLFFAGGGVNGCISPSGRAVEQVASVDPEAPAKPCAAEPLTEKAAPDSEPPEDAQPIEKNAESEPLDPQRWVEGPVELRQRCGPGSSNPNGHVLKPPAKRDGTCIECEVPPTELPICENVESQRAWGASSLAVGQRVTLRGHVGVPPHWLCQGVGGMCVCHGRCYGALRVVFAAEDFSRWPRNAPHHLVLEVPKDTWPTFTDSSGIVHSYGDESSICHALRIPDGQRSAEVIVSGTISSRGMEGEVNSAYPANAKAHRLILDTICRVEDANSH